MMDASKIKLDPALRDKLLSDEVRIKTLRDQREKTLREMVPESDELDPMLRNFAQTEQVNSFPLEYNRIQSNEPAGPRSPYKESPAKLRTM